MYPKDHIEGKHDKFIYFILILFTRAIGFFNLVEDHCWPETYMYINYTSYFGKQLTDKFGRAPLKVRKLPIILVISCYLFVGCFDTIRCSIHSMVSSSLCSFKIVEK